MIKLFSLIFLFGLYSCNKNINEMRWEQLDYRDVSITITDSVVVSNLLQFTSDTDNDTIYTYVSKLIEVVEIRPNMTLYLIRDNENQYFTFFITEKLNERGEFQIETYFIDAPSCLDMDCLENLKNKLMRRIKLINPDKFILTSRQ